MRIIPAAPELLNAASLLISLSLNLHDRRLWFPVSDYVNLIITDIEMPQLDGLTLCRRFKTGLGCSHIPVVIFSSLINEKMTHKCKEVHADGFITKPQMGQLVDMMDGLLGL